MSELPPDARRLLAAAKAGQARTDAARRERVRSALSAAIAADAPPRFETEEVGGLPHLRGVRRMLGSGKWLLLGGALTLGAWSLRAAHDAAPLRHAARSTPGAAPSEARAVAPPSAVSLSPSTSTQLERVSSKQGAPPPRALPTGESVPRATTAPSDLRQEMRLLGDAEAALRRGEPARALSFLRTHRAGFPRGQLREERIGLTLIAECTLRLDPSDAARRYLAKAPHSVLRARVAEACRLVERP